MKYIDEHIKTEIQGQYDVIVCGGGPAGLSAAISAARCGLKTLLLEAGGCIGGVWTSGLLSCILDVEGKGGLMAEIKAGLVCQNAVHPRPQGHPHNFLYDAEKMKTLVEMLCVEAGVEILLYTRVVDAYCEDRCIKAVIVENYNGRQAFLADSFIDCTGNGDFSAQAQCGFDEGHPESGKLQPASIQAIVIGVPEEFQVMETYEQKRSFYQYLREHYLDTSGKAPTIARLPFGKTFIFSINHEIGVRFDSTKDLTDASIRARAEIDRTISALKKVQGWEQLQLVTTSAHIGIREGRRIRGRYQLSLNDIVSGQRFHDAVCLARFAVDIHALDKDATHGYGNEGIQVQPYHIPYRSLVAKDRDNLGIAGRCISGDFYAHASYRVTGNSVPMGEAVGYAAFLAKKNHCTLSDVDGTLISKEMQKRGYEI